MIPSSMLHEHTTGPSLFKNILDKAKLEESQESLAKNTRIQNQSFLPTKLVSPLLDYTVSMTKNHNHPPKPSKFVKKYPILPSPHQMRQVSETQVIQSVRNNLNLSGILDELHQGIQGSHRMFAGSLQQELALLKKGREIKIPPILQANYQIYTQQTSPLQSPKITEDGPSRQASQIQQKSQLSSFAGHTRISPINDSKVHQGSQPQIKNSEE